MRNYERGTRNSECGRRGDRAPRSAFRAILFGFIFAFCIMSSALAAHAASTTSVTQYGITFTFDQAYPYGKFANGDYWVVPNSPGGKVRIVSMTPDYNGRNGWEVNPTNFVTQ